MLAVILRCHLLNIGGIGMPFLLGKCALFSASILGLIRYNMTFSEMSLLTSSLVF